MKHQKNIKEGLKFYRRSIKQEHISLIEELGSKYLGHLSPSGLSAYLIKNSILNLIATKNIDTQKFVAVRYDGIAVNTGNKGGAIRLLKRNIIKHCNG